ncbi:MAG: hypothetical protein IT198_16910 [Acidimicrobiia bacterium]|nr:hypothetical protein [Acidimicrobiia bacterium]
MSFTLEGMLSGRRVVVVWDDGEVDAGSSTDTVIDLVEALEDEVEAQDGSLVRPSLLEEECALAAIAEVLDDVDIVEHSH